MLRRISLFALCLLAGTALCGGLSAEKITVDPNASGAPAVELQSEETDARLGQKVTYEGTKKPVVTILKELSEKTGVTLSAGSNKHDWQVRDRKMNIFSKDSTLASLMNSIARVMKFKWSKEKLKDGKYVYRLYMDRRSLLDEESKRAREEERLAKLESERRLKSLESLTELEDLSPQDLAKLRKENPFKYMIAKSGISKPLKGFFNEVPAITQALASGQAMDMPASALSPQGKRMMLDTMKGLRKIESLAEGKPDPGGEVTDNLDQMTIRINANLDRMREMQGASFMLGEIRVTGEGQHGVEIPLFDPESNMAKMIGEMLASAEETGKPMDDKDNREEMQQRFIAAFMSDVARDEPEKEQADRQDEPALHAKVKIKPKTDALPDVEAALASASGLAVVSDHFAKTFGVSPPKDKEMELVDLLEKLGTAFRYDWDKRGSVIEMRDKKWYKKRAAQIPEAWIEAWRNTLKTTGTLGLGDMAQICSLTQEQYTENIATDEVLKASGIAGNYYVGKDILKLYAMLGESQRFALSTESGLDLRSLTPEQWTQAEKTIRSTRPSLLQNQDGPLVLVLDRKDEDADHKYYRFRVLSSADEPDPPKWRIAWPKYVEPPKEQKPNKPEEKEPEQK